MPCTTILVGRKASYDGSTIVARNEDAPSGEFTPKKFIVVNPEEQPRLYESVGSHLKIELPDEPMRYTALPNALPDEGVWASAGVNEANVTMSATETLTTNERVLGADPLVEYKAAHGQEGDDDYVAERLGGIGEEDMVTLVLPYIHSAREGVERLGSLLEQYGTYEMNGIAFADVDEIWWLETVGGHHWIAKRVPDNAYVTMPNQLGIDYFDLEDALGQKREHMCSSDMREFIEDHHLDLALGDASLNPRDAFGSHSDADHVYNTPRAWSMQRCLNPHDLDFCGDHPKLRPTSDDIPWDRVPERKITIEDVKYVLSLHYQGTPYDPYGHGGANDDRNRYRPIGINRNCQLSVVQLRPYVPESIRAVQWVAFGCNVFNVLVPLYANVSRTPEYLANTSSRVSTESHYWSNRLIAALCDAHFNTCAPHVERYQLGFGGFAYSVIESTDHKVKQESYDYVTARPILEVANDRIAQGLQTRTDELLGKVLYTASMGMRNGFSRSDG